MPNRDQADWNGLYSTLIQIINLGLKFNSTFFFPTLEICDKGIKRIPRRTLSIAYFFLNDFSTKENGKNLGEEGKGWSILSYSKNLFLLKVL